MNRPSVRLARQLDPDVGPAAVAVGGVRAAPVGAGDRLDDRQAEPRAIASPSLVGAAEALEGPVEEVVRESRSAVLDMDLEVARGLPGAGP